MSKNIISWFSEHNKPKDSIDVTVRTLDDSSYSNLKSFLLKNIQDCYISKADLNNSVTRTGLSASDILQNKMPDVGNIKSGDFGEILTLFYLASENKKKVKRVMKWRYKQDRNKAAPHSDVIILYRKNKNKPSIEDFVICAESKAKATRSNSEPIKNSIIGYEGDKTGRLARTLIWLKEKAIDSENAKSISYVKRFADDIISTKFLKKYRAVSVIDKQYLDDELVKDLEIPDQSDEFQVIVLGIESLQDLYEECFKLAINEAQI